MKIINYTLIFFTVVLSLYLLHLGKRLVLPLVIAFVFFYIIINVSNLFHSGLCRVFGKPAEDKTKLIKTLNSASLLLSISSFVMVIWFLSYIINTNINDIIDTAPEYNQRLVYIITRMNQYIQNILQRFSIPLNFNLSNHISGIIRAFDMGNMASGIKAITSFAGNTTFVVIYLLFLLLEQRSASGKISFLESKGKKWKDFFNVLDEINRDFKTYFKVKFFSSLTTGILSYLVLLIVGVDFANFWALTIFILNFIPTVGSIFAVIFPIFITIVQFGTLSHFLVVSILLTSIQVMIGTILEPRFMGTTLNLSPIIILLSLGIWGQIWGVMGMFLSVPIMVGLTTILGKFPETRFMAVILSSDVENENFDDTGFNF